MKEVLDEIISFSSSYLQPDLLAKNKELFSQKKNLLDETEKHEFLAYLANKGKALIFLAFCDEVKVSFSLSQAENGKTPTTRAPCALAGAESKELSKKTANGVIPITRKP